MFAVFEQRNVATSRVFPRKVNSTIGELRTADWLMWPRRRCEVRSHEHDLCRVNGRASVEVDDVKPMKLRKKKKESKVGEEEHAGE